MYIHTKKKIIICKFYLKNKCQFGEKCKFRHIGVSELNDILNKFEDLKQENTSLKRDLKDKNIKLSNLKNKYFDVTNDSVHALEKPLYNSFFCSKKMPKNQKEKQIGESKQWRESEESGIDDDFETRDKISGKSEIKLETQTHMKTKIKDTLKNDQNNKESASLLQNKQSEIGKNFSYQETQRQDEAKTNENFFNELKNFINVLNSKTKKNTSEILELQAAIERFKKNEDMIIATIDITNERIEGLKCEITANRSYTYEFLDELAFTTTKKRISEEIGSYESILKRTQEGYMNNKK
jgi:hypothetical protein